MTKSYQKICPICHSQNTKKDWTRKWRQSYKCNNCKHIRVSIRRKKDIWAIMYKEYAVHKQTYHELWLKYWISSKTVQKKLDEYVVIESWSVQLKEVILLIDTTYFWGLWVMVFKDAKSKELLHYEIVWYETNEWYRRWIKEVESKWRKIKAIICDWRRWLLWGFWEIPTQMCHFHQVQIIRKYITKKPILEANRELKEIVDWLTRTDKESFESELNRWYEKHKRFIQEKWVNEKWKKYYIHRRTRSAYYSLKRNLPYLFVYHDYDWILDIPNTTNGIEALFSHLKYKVNLHRWLSKKRQLKLIKYLLLYRK